jgi:hypothetical protein
MNCLFLESSMSNLQSGKAKVQTREDDCISYWCDEMGGKGGRVYKSELAIV